MADRKYNVRIQSPRDVSVNWENNNPILLDGEVIIVYDVNGTGSAFKIGDGNSSYNDLPYFTNPFGIPKEDKAAPNGVATLDVNGKVPLDQLPEGFSLGGGGTGEDLTLLTQKPKQRGILEYNGENQMPVFQYYDKNALIIGGIIEAMNADTYIASFTPAPGYGWADGTTGTIYVEWEIKGKPVDVPSTESAFTYDGEYHTPEWDGYDSAIMTVTGDVSAVDAGNKEAIFILNGNYVWSDTNTNEPRTLAWSIEQAEGELAVDPASKTLTK